MGLRRRLALIVALIAAVVITCGGLTAWGVTRSVLRGNVDDALRAQARSFQEGPRGFRDRLRQLDRAQVSPYDSPYGAGPDPAAGQDPGGYPGGVPAPPARLGGPAEYAQAIVADGKRVIRGDVSLPVSDEDRAVIGSGGMVGPRDVTVGDAHLRMMTVGLPGIPAAVQFARPLNGTDDALRTLALVLLAVGLVTVGTAAVLGRGVARRILRPVSDLAGAAAHVEATEDLGRRLPVRSDDEVGELTRRFNGMLARLQGSRRALDRSIEDQRNLVADASHELRTPVTSLRTNAEVLLEDDGSIGETERRSILTDVRDQAEDLGLLVSDLIELARGDAPAREADEPVALDDLVREMVTRARRDHRGVSFAVEAEALVVCGRPDRLGRALSNLLDNAARYAAGDGGAVEVRVVPGPEDSAEVHVVDHGAGVPEQDRERIFDRFRRGDSARERPGSGLGLAIVRQVAATHDGRVWVQETPGGGATFVLRIPRQPDDDAAAEPTVPSGESATEPPDAAG
ncbi:ATP-binding region ATPase domain protein [Patulibacter medicamentivorans]|uniref:histidine kinase n=1 Tax=Patulibacter medicamentivorans TaxID=1097667 RepID=H0EBD8_9ACTN|nr:HAMP domain-containing sensor histidine kinase [Patulibacter medicamentivorans]EHN09014.1 ATP-binding region ATPase domain protein [Patulibacter medicamentivorans]